MIMSSLMGPHRGIKELLSKANKRIRDCRENPPRASSLPNSDGALPLPTGMPPPRRRQPLFRLKGATFSFSPFPIYPISSSSDSLLQWCREVQVKARVGRGEGWGRWSCRKKDIHPTFYEDAKVYCNGELVMTTGGTQPEYVIDVWSGNHPFYLGNRSALLINADQVEKFRKKFGELSNFMEIPILKGEIVLPAKKKPAGKGKGKK